MLYLEYFFLSLSLSDGCFHLLATWESALPLEWFETLPDLTLSQWVMTMILCCLQCLMLRKQCCLYSCFQMCNELWKSSWVSPEDVYVWTQMSEWEPPEFLWTLSAWPPSVKSTKSRRSRCGNIAGDPLQDSQRAKVGFFWRFNRRNTQKWKQKVNKYLSIKSTLAVFWHNGCEVRQWVWAWSVDL